jgi:hypothetical protein
MKTLYLLSLLLAIGTACQHQTRTAYVAAPIATKETARLPVAPVKQQLPILFTAADTLTIPMRKLVEHYDLSKLWKSDVEGRRENPTLEGFFGPDHYRFALVFNEVKRDMEHPEIYHIRGKSHYRKNIRPFTGRLTVRQVKDLPRWFFFLAGAGSSLADTAAASTYTARAQLQLTEENAENSGTFEAEAILDFYVVNNPVQIGYVTGVLGVEPDRPARGTGLVLRGKRLNQTTNQVKNFVVSTDAFGASLDIYKDFGIGDRGYEINPKYAKLGWNEKWENDEWWADTPKPSLNM